MADDPNYPKQPTELKCDVCGKVACGVASSAFGAISLAYCRECLDKPADAECMFAHLWWDVANKNIDALDSSIKSWFTFKDGKYISFEEWVKWAKTQPDPIYPEPNEDDSSSATSAAG